MTRSLGAWHWRPAMQNSWKSADGCRPLVELNYPAAEASLQASLLNNPFGRSASGSHLALGYIAGARGDLAVALDHCRRALRIDDSAAYALASYAESLWNAGQNREAIKVADTGIDLVKSGLARAYLLAIKALANHSLGETAAANAALDDALASVGPALKPVLAGALAQRGSDGRGATARCRTRSARTSPDRSTGSRLRRVA